MQVFKVFMKILRSKIGIAMMYLSIFLSIGIASANSSQEQADFTESRAGIVINDLDKSSASEALCEYLADSNDVTYGAPDDKEILDGVYYNASRYYLTINKGFSDGLASGETKNIITHATQNGSYFENLVDSKIDMYLTTARAYIAGGSSTETALEQAAKALEKKTEVEMVSESGSEYAKTVYSYFKFIPYIFMGIFIFALCPVVIVMTGKEIKNRTFSSAISQKKFLFETALGAVVFLTFIYLLVVIFVPLVIFRCEFTREIGLAMLNSLAFTVFCGAIVLFISNLVDSEKLVSLIGNIVSLGMSFLCGVFVPLEFLGDGVKKVAVFLPAYWYEVLNSAIAGTDSQVYSDSLMKKCILIQLAFAAALVVATLAVMKARQAKVGESASKAEPQAA